ncbi:MAG: HRDC domain-containing protein, partial [Selenomonadaceae bacterium]|nr:HRDC domain-containing protein [Selenomonadaceae bacterium]
EKEKKAAPQAPGLFQTLRELRKKLARRDNVPPYVIFSDATLREMCRLRPKTLNQLREVKGVGEAKLKKYGKEFLACLLAGI